VRCCTDLSPTIIVFINPNALALLNAAKEPACNEYLDAVLAETGIDLTPANDEARGTNYLPSFDAVTSRFCFFRQNTPLNSEALRKLGSHEQPLPISSSVPWLHSIVGYPLSRASKCDFLASVAIHPTPAVPGQLFAQIDAGH
jgi:hypothetical protein